jgi:alpha-N-arabinofuranosidase
MLGTEPYISANVGSGSVKELMDWVQYVNFDGSSPMSDLRRSNGRIEPWKVKYWGLGNEMWGCGGNMRAEFYADLYRQFATFMTDWSNSTNVFRIASGAQSSDYRWTEVLMRNIPLKLMEGLSLHHYSVIDWGMKGPASTYEESHYFASMKVALAMNEILAKHSAIMDDHDPERRVALIVDEWGGWYDVEPGTNPALLYQQNTMRDAVIAGLTLNIFNGHAERVRMANLAQTINVLQSVILTEGEKFLLTPTYYVMEMYKVHHDATRLPVLTECEIYTDGKDDLPALSASASINNNSLNLTIVNIDHRSEHTANFTLPASDFSSYNLTSIASSRIQDYNSFDNPDYITPKRKTNIPLEDELITLTLPPASVILLEIFR